MCLRSGIRSAAVYIHDMSFQLLRKAPPLRYPIISLTAAMLASFTVGCISVRHYWRLTPEKTPRSSYAVIPYADRLDAVWPAYGKNLRVIEFDDQGDKWESDQRKEAVKVIKSLRPGGTVIVFIHGWQNNADPDRNPNDLLRFNNFLNKFSRDYRNTAGIYIGWKGRSLSEDIPLSFALDKLTFPGRRAATTRLSSPAMLDCLWSLRRAANEQDCRVVLVGHSFGARILENVAASSILSYNSYLREKRNEGGVSLHERRSRVIGDLILLINPASESLHTRQMRLATRNWPANEPPGLITLTSKTDVATKGIWKVGKSLEKWLAPTVPIQDREYWLGYKNASVPNKSELQSRYIETTSGHNPSLITGRLIPDSPTFTDYSPPAGTYYRIEAGCHPVFQLDPGILDGHNGKLADTKRTDPEGIFNDRMVELCKTLYHSTMSRHTYLESSLGKFINATNIVIREQ